MASRWICKGRLLGRIMDSNQPMDIVHDPVGVDKYCRSRSCIAKGISYAYGPSQLPTSSVLTFPTSSKISGIDSAEYSNNCSFTKEYKGCSYCTFCLCFLLPTTPRLERVFILS